MAGSIWKGSISFGLLNIPVSLQKAEDPKELSFRMLDEKDLSPIKYKKVNSTDGKEVPWERIVKGYEVDSGQYVLITKDDFKKANPKATQTIDIQDFVSAEEISSIYFEKPYYLVPQKSGVKGYYLLVEALKKSNRLAIATVVIRTKMHLVALMPMEDYLMMEILRFPHEVLTADEVSYLEDIERPKFSAKELKMAMELIDGMSAEWNPEQYKDTYSDDLLELINTKLVTGETSQIKEEEKVATKGNTGVVVDLMPLLKKSLEQRVKKKTSKKKTMKKKAS